jgi:hypothetical protein
LIILIQRFPIYNESTLAMIQTPNLGSVSVLGVAILTTLIGSISVAQAQIPLPVYTVPLPTTHDTGHGFRHGAGHAQMVPVDAMMPAFYAPQVPVIPMANGPVPTMSAYYVPTVPVTQTFYAPVIRTGRFRRHFNPVLPSAIIHPIYWTER